MRIFLFLLVIICTIGYSFGQQPSYFRFAEKEFEGVDIYDVIQDKDFNYYFATDQGIFIHDGYSFKKIECDEMSGGSVFHFEMNQNGTIYCHNLNNQIFQIKNKVCTLIFTIPDIGSDISIIITADNRLIISSSRNIYILNSNNQLVQSTNFGTRCYFTSPFNLCNGQTIIHQTGSNDIWLYENGKLKSTKLQVKNSNHFPFVEALHFYKANNQSYAIYSIDNKIYQIDEKTLTLYYLNDIKWNPNTGNVRFYGVDNNLWLASNISGVVKASKGYKFDNNQTKLFPDFFISDIFKDKEGNILLSTFDEGILVIPNLKVNDVESVFNSHFVTRLYATKNNLFLGTRDGKVLQYNQQLKEISCSGRKAVEELSAWPGRDFVISDNTGFSIINLKSGIEKPFTIGSLKDVAYTNDDHFFIALNIGLFEYKYNSKLNVLEDKKSYISGRIYNVEYEKLSDFIYTSTFEGLKYIDDKRNVHSLKINHKIINATSLFSIGDKTYISTRKHGVLIVKKGKIIKQFYPKHNNETLVISKLIIHNSTIYANTQYGFVILNLKGKIKYFLNKSSGLSTNKIIDFAIHENLLWIAHSRGVQNFKISEITTTVQAPKLTIRQIIVNGKRTQNSKENRFTNDQNKFKFVLQVPTLKHRENIRYHYKLEGNNEQWIVNEYEDNEIVYNALGSGNYRFVVKAENNGVFSNEMYYSFSISAPFYQQLWFLVLIASIFILIVILIYRRQLKIQRKKAKQINELNASRLTAIQSQMNPHFIFNSLNSIQDLVLKGDIDNSYTFITKFSNLVRRTLNYSDKDFIDFEQEIKLIELYLSLEKLRFKEDLNYSIDTNSIEDIMIPPMLIQPFIENALLHGLLHKEGIKKLKIKFILDEVLICEITDNGIGREKALEIKSRQRANHESFAVNAIKRRFNILKVHFKGELGFVIKDVIENDKVAGTKVTLRIPVKNKF